MELAIRNPAKQGKYRVFNQFVETFSVNDLAEKVKKVGSAMGLNVDIQPIKNPRREAEEHYYNPKHTGLLELGLKPHYLSDEVIGGMLEFVSGHKDKINEDYILPKVSWL